MSLPHVPKLDTIAKRLPAIFPEGIEHRGYVVRDIAVKTVFVMLYAGAVQNSDRWVRPSYIYFMTEDNVTSGQAQTNVLTGEAFASLAPPTCIESVVASVPTEVADIVTGVP